MGSTMIDYPLPPNVWVQINNGALNPTVLSNTGRFPVLIFVGAAMPPVAQNNNTQKLLPDLETQLTTSAGDLIFVKSTFDMPGNVNAWYGP